MTRKDCKFRKLKGDPHMVDPEKRAAVIHYATIILIIWIAVTLLMWGFTQKTVTVHECKNVTDSSSSSWGTNSNGSVVTKTVCIDRTGSWSSYYDSPCLSRNICSDVSHKEYYSLTEILVQQKDFTMSTVIGTFEWIISHPVVQG